MYWRQCKQIITQTVALCLFQGWELIYCWYTGSRMCYGCHDHSNTDIFQQRGRERERERESGFIYVIRLGCVVLKGSVNVYPNVVALSLIGCSIQSLATVC